MTWDDYSLQEKIALFRSALHVGYCDYLGSGIGRFLRAFKTKTHDLNYSQEQYLSMLLTRMDVNQTSFINGVKLLSDTDMVSILKQMSSAKKDFVFSVWASVLCRFGGSVFWGASISLNDFPEEHVRTVQQLAQDANINIPHCFSMTEYGAF